MEDPTRLKDSMDNSTVWWLSAGVVIALELLSGTFYLLMVSLGLVGAAVAAHLGAASTLQFTVAAAVGGGSVVAWRSYKRRQAPGLPASANRDVNLDIGESVQVDEWLGDGTSSVKYRGANWQVSLVPGALPSAGLHTIEEVVGSRLIVRKL